LCFEQGMELGQGYGLLWPGMELGLGLM
jgi:hypothetical protein